MSIRQTIMVLSASAAMFAALPLAPAMGQGAAQGSDARQQAPRGGAIEARVSRLESEMRAVQRKVFPGGAGQLVQPQISPDAPGTSQIGTPATSPVVDLTARVTSLESQMATMTGQIEQTQFRLRQLEDAFAAYKRTTDARLAALETTASSPGGGIGGAAAGTTTSAPVIATTPAGTGTTTTPSRPANGNPTTSPATSAATTAAKPAAAQATAISKDPERLKAVAAIEKPKTADPIEDSYIYGYRLWQAKLYPEAEAQLRAFVKANPKHRRTSYAQNLLGRALLDQNKPSLASLAFYENYRTNPEGERAPDSLFYLAQALKKLNKPASEVCKVYAELTEAYGPKLSAAMKADVARGRSEARCP